MAWLLTVVNSVNFFFKFLFCSSSLNFYSSHVFMSCPFKQTKKTKQTNKNFEKLKTQFPIFCTFWCFFVSLWLLHVESVLFNSIIWFSKKSQNVIFFLSFPFFWQLLLHEGHFVLAKERMVVNTLTDAADILCYVSLFVFDSLEGTWLDLAQKFSPDALQCGLNPWFWYIGKG